MTLKNSPAARPPSGWSTARSGFRHPQAEAQLSSEGAKLKKATEVIELALGLAESCPDAYLRAQPDVRKLWNQAFLGKILVRSGPSTQAQAVYEEPFASLLGSKESGSHKSRIVELPGIEPGSPDPAIGLLRA